MYMQKERSLRGRSHVNQIFAYNSRTSSKLFCCCVVKSFCVIPFFHDFRDYLVKVSYDSVVSNFHDRSIRILVDRYDAVGSLHTS